MNNSYSYKFQLSFANFAFYSSIAVVVFILFNLKTIPNDSILIILLPLIFGLYMKFSIVEKYNTKFFSLFLFNLFAFIKYSILPLLMVVNKNYFVFNWMQKNDMTNSYILMIYELLCVIITITFICKRLKYINLNYKIGNSSNSNTVYIIAIIIGIFGILYQPLFLQKLIFFSNDVLSVYDNNEEIFDKGALSALLFYFIIYIQVIFFIITLKRVHKNRSKSNVAILIIAALLNCIFVWSSNRAGVLTVILLTGYSIWLVFPHKKKFILAMFSTVGIILIISLTTYRYFNKFEIKSVESSQLVETFGLEGLPYMIDIYLSGPSSVTIGREATDYYNNIISSTTLRNDLLISTNVIHPLMTKSGIDVFKTTSYYYNQYTGRNSSYIIPMICQGRVYLGDFLSPLFIVIVIILMFKFEMNSKRNVDLAMKYVWLLLALRFSLVLGYSIPIIIRAIFIEFLPLYLIIYSNRKFVFK